MTFLSSEIGGGLRDVAQQRQDSIAMQTEHILVNDQEQVLETDQALDPVSPSVELHLIVSDVRAVQNTSLGSATARRSSTGISVPPSQTRICPVVNVLRDDAKKATTSAIRSGSPSRPIGSCVVSAATWSGSCSGTSSQLPRTPGATASTRTLRGANSTARDRVMSIEPGLGDCIRAASRLGDDAPGSS